MKRLFSFLMALLAGTIVLAQVPQAFKYQAVVRDHLGNVLAQRDVTFKISIIEGTVTGAIVYSELHSKKSNDFGLVDLEIGKGTSPSGSFSAINWGVDAHFIKVEMDPAGGTAYQLMGTSQLLSVPYSLHAKTVESVSTDATLAGSGSTAPLKIAPQSASVGQVLKWDGTTWKPAGDEVSSGTGSNPIGPAGGDLTGSYPDPTIGAGKVNSMKILDGTITTNDLGANCVSTGNIADNTILTADLTDNVIATAKIATGAVTGNKIAQAGATTGQVLKWDGSTWTPGSSQTVIPGGTTGQVQFNNAGAFGGDANLVWDNTNKRLGIGINPYYPLHAHGSSSAIFGDITSSPGAAVTGRADAASGDTYGVSGESASTSGTGVRGWATAASGNTHGIAGESASTSGTGVLGWATATSGITYGVKGQSGSSSGIGVVGSVTSTSGLNIGVYGESNSSSGTGVVGSATSTSGGAVGVRGNSIEGTGVLGWATSTSGGAVGVKGQSDSSSGRGIFGNATASSGSTYGVYGQSQSSSGIGVRGLASASTGSTYGVYGESHSSSGGIGIAGYSTATSGNADGVIGRSESSTGRGVFGWASSFSGTNIGVLGNSESTAGKGVSGIASANSGTNFGVSGITNSPDGFSGYFSGGRFYVSGNVGIGAGTVYNPVYQLDVNGEIASRSANGLRLRQGSYSVIHRNDNSYHYMLLTNQNDPDGTWNNFRPFAVDLATGNILLGLNTKVVMGIDGGLVGIGILPSNYKLEVNGTAAKTGGGSWSNLSDVRLKNLLGNFEKGLSEIAALQPVMFTYKEENPRKLPSGEKQVGFIAQDVIKVFPEAVNECKDGYLDFNMHAINVAMVNAIKELKAENDRLKAENKQQQSRIEGLESRLLKLEGLLEFLSIK